MTVTNVELKNMDFVKVNSEIGYAIKKDDGTFCLWSGQGMYYRDQLPTIEEFTLPTNEEKVELLKKNFSWGEIINVHIPHINHEYIIFEYIDKMDEKIRFHNFLNFRTTNTSHSSFEFAVLGLMERKYKGLNSEAAMHCGLILQLSEYKPTVKEQDGLKGMDFVKVDGELGYAIKKDDGTFGFWSGRGSYWRDQLTTIKEFVIPTNEEKVELLQKNFSWGGILNVHIPKSDYEYVIFEYYNETHQSVLFHTILNFDSTNHSYESFDSAMLGLFEVKYQGYNSQAAMHCERIFGMNKNKN